MSAPPKAILELATAAIQLATAMAPLVTLVLVRKGGKRMPRRRSTASRGRRKAGP